jgi:trimeric autotransporter adhesin
MKHEIRKKAIRSVIVKRYLTVLSFALAFFMLHASCFAPSVSAQGNVGIGTTAPDASALLDLTSTSRGLLIPRMTEAQRIAVASPATGLLVYETNTSTASSGIYSGTAPTFWYYNGTFWQPFLGGGWLLLGNAGTNASTNFIGTTDSVDWIIRTNNTEHVRVYAGGNVGLTNGNNAAEELRFYEPSGSGSFYTGFKAGINTAAVTYTLPLGDGNGLDYVLCTDGFANLSWRGFGTSGGGGVDTLWLRGSGRLALQGIGSGNTASGDYSIAAGLNNLASGTGSMCWGESDRATGTGSVVSGGQDDTASGIYSTIGGGANNSATGSYSEVGGGSSNSACGNYAIVVGGSNNTACGNYATVLGGSGNSVTGNYSLAFGVGATVTTDNTIVYYNSGSTVKMGIGTYTPAEALDVTGNVRFSGALMPNGNAGTSGYVLASTGSGTPPIWSAASNLYWSTLGNTGTSSSTNYLGTSDAHDLVFRTNNTERMRILSTGQVGIGVTTTTHQLHSLYSGTTDETAAIFGNATGATSNQAIGVWGTASNGSGGNTGTIGVLATGNGNNSSGNTNVALQLNDGELAMGRTTESPSVGTDVEGAASGTAYSQQGPSGVIELTLGGGNLSTSAPTSGVFQNLGTLTINNRYCTSSSIVLVSVVSKIDDGSAPDSRLAEYLVDVSNRTTGAFDIRVGMIPTTTSLSNYTTSDKIRVGYMIVNPGR